jgi:dTDP-4-amino-4,6-dideoxygalactose transaminase
MDPILAFAKVRKLPVIEDNARRSALHKGQADRIVSDAARLSFYPTKNLGRIRRRGHGLIEFSGALGARPNTATTVRWGNISAASQAGITAWMKLQAAILRVKLRHLSSWQRARRPMRGVHAVIESNSGVMPPITPEGFEHVFHQYTIRVEKRDALQNF